MPPAAPSGFSELTDTSGDNLTGGTFDPISWWTAVTVAAVAACYCFCICACYRRRRRKKKKDEEEQISATSTKDELGSASVSSYPSIPSITSLVRELSHELSSTPLHSPKDYARVVLDEHHRASFYPPPPEEDVLEVPRRNLCTVDVAAERV